MGRGRGRGSGGGNTAGVIAVADCSAIISRNPSGIGTGRGRGRGGNSAGVIAVADCSTIISRNPSCIGIGIGIGRGRGRGRGNTAVCHPQIFDHSSAIAEQARIYISVSCLYIHIEPFNYMPIPIKHTNKRCSAICSNRLPALTVIIKFSAHGKISFGKGNIRHHFKVGTPMVPDIV